jgi:hypothetical protein
LAELTQYSFACNRAFTLNRAEMGGVEFQKETGLQDRVPHLDFDSDCYGIAPKNFRRKRSKSSILNSAEIGWAIALSVVRAESN